MKLLLSTKYSDGIVISFYRYTSEKEIIENCSHILLNSREFPLSPQYKIYNNLLKLSSTIINIRISQKKSKRVCLRKIINKSLNHLFKDMRKFSKNEKIEDEKAVASSSASNSFKIFPIILLVLFSILTLIFIFDFQTIQMKINEGNLKKISELRSQYDQNRCKEKGHLDSLKLYCESTLNEIKLLETLSPSVISTFFIWILDIFNSAYKAFGYTNMLITLLSLFLIKKII